MRRNMRWLGLMAAVVLLTGVLMVWAGKPDKAAPGEGQPGKNQASREEKGPGKPDDWFVVQRAYPEKTLSQQKFKQAAKEARQMAPASSGEFSGMTGGVWETEGPVNIGGRVVDLVPDPKQKDTLFIAAATGGVWKSTDAGKTFSTAWDDGNTQSMGALAADSKGTLFAGTGEANPGGGSIVFGGSGLYRSKNGGQSWDPVGLEDSGSIGRIAVDPTDDRRIFAAAAGPLFTPGEERGLYRSKDGGNTWEPVLKGPNDTTGAIDVSIDPKDPDTVYAALWDRIRKPEERVYGGKGTGLYRSKDGGDSWERLDGGLPASSEDNGRYGIAVSPSDPDRLYAILIRTNGYFKAFYTSNDGGDTWEEVPADPTLKNSQSSFGWWFGRMWADPGDADHLFVAGVTMMESKDGGKSWKSSTFSSFHADQHALAWDPLDKGRVYLGNDGGVYRSEENGAVTGKWTKSEVQPYNQFYTLDVSKQDPARISGGTQDNGSLRTWDGQRWNAYYGGDGLVNLIHPENPQIVYACYQYGNCARSEDGGKTMISFAKQTVSDRRNWQTPLVFDPNDPTVLYYGGNRLNRSTDGGKTWEVISPDLTAGPGNDAYPFGTITAVAASQTDGAVLYAGTDDGRLWSTRNGGKDWTQIGGKELPQRWVTRVAVDPKHRERAIVTFSGFRSGDNKAHVFRTNDGGKTWTDISGNLPDAPVNDLVIDPQNRQRLYVATDVGVFATPNGGRRWYKLGDDLPLAPVTDIHYHAASGQWFIATYGRGVYKLAKK